MLRILRPLAIALTSLGTLASAQTLAPRSEAFITDQAPGPTRPSLAEPGRLAPAPAPLPVPRSLPTPPMRFASTPAAALPTPGLGFAVRFSEAPKMMGDFFGPPVIPAIATQPIGSGLFNLNSRLQLITNLQTDPVLLDASPSGQFDPPVPDPGPVVDGLTRASDPAGRYSAILQTGDNLPLVVPTPVDFNDTNGNGIFDPGEPTFPGLAQLYAVFRVGQSSVVITNPGDAVGRTRVYDNNSAWPTDRVYFDYSYFHNARLTASGVDVNRFAPGFEKTFGDGLGSVEFRAPMAATLSSSVDIDAPLELAHYELGNLMLTTKLLLTHGEEWAAAVGLGVTVPTADDFNLVTSTGSRLVTVQNETVQLSPFLAVQYASADGEAFAHAFLTFDFAANGNTIVRDPETPFEQAGVWQTQHLISLNGAYGRYLYRADDSRDRLQALAWSAELHYSATLNDSDSLTLPDAGLGSLTIDAADADLSLLNATFGVHAQIGQTVLTAGYVTPLTSSDRVFDGELRVLANRTF